MDFEKIECGHSIFKCPSELHLDESYKHEIHSTIRKWLIDSQTESEAKKRLTLGRTLVDISNFEVAEKVLQCNVNILAQKLPSIDDIVDMAKVISKNALHEFSLTKCEEPRIEFTQTSLI